MLCNDNHTPCALWLPGSYCQRPTAHDLRTTSYCQHPTGNVLLSPWGSTIQGKATEHPGVKRSICVQWHKVPEICHTSRSRSTSRHIRQRLCCLGSPSPLRVEQVVWHGGKDGRFVAEAVM